MLPKKFFSFKQRIKTYFSKREKPMGCVFMFHKITDSDSSDEFSISMEHFQCFVNYFFDKDSVSSLENIGVNNGKVYLSFDDGDISVVKYALPFLKTNEIPFTVFITNSYLDTPGYISTDELVTLSKYGFCSIGSHTISHPLLRYSKSKKQEIVESKLMLENVLEKSIFLFAYPYGSIYACDKKSVKIVRAAGFEYAFSTIQSCFSRNSLSKRFFIPRINVNDSNYLEIMNDIEKKLIQ